MGKGWLPRVLQVVPRFQASGGVERGTLDIARALLNQTDKTFVLSSGGDMVSPFEAAGGTHLEMPVHTKNPFSMVQNIGKIQQVINDFKIDVVHARSRAPAWSAYVAARALKVPFVTTYHAPYSSGSSLKRTYNSVMARGDAVISISSFVKEHMMKEYQHLDWFDPGKVEVIHRGIDTDLFDPQRADQAQVASWRERLNLGPQQRVILLAGRMTAWKGQMLLLEAFARLQGAVEDVVLVLAGSDQGRGAYVQQLKQRSAELGISDHVRLLPHIHDLPGLYQMSHGVVSASMEPEGFGRVVAEAGAMGKPVVAADHGGAKEIVVHQETGFLFQPNQVADLVGGLQTLFALDPSAYQAMGQAARNRVIEHFSQAHFCRKTLGLYETVNAVAKARLLRA